ncbi:MbtH family NRPS accessory protein [Rugamonas sp. A1-17]|nr:MbtH family NRPS accessory protein [Rugamonas sp. A1-17]
MPNQHAAEVSLFEVIVNEADEYAVWGLGKPLPPGWTSVGLEGSQAACLDYINVVSPDRVLIAEPAAPAAAPR